MEEKMLSPRTVPGGPILVYMKKKQRILVCWIFKNLSKMSQMMQSTVTIFWIKWIWASSQVYRKDRLM